MTRVFIGDKEVRKEDLEKYEIKSDTVKQILADKFSSRSKNERRGTA